MKMFQLKYTAFAAIALLLAFTSCGDLLEQKPPDTGATVLPSEAIQTADDLQEVLISAYDVLANTYNGNMQNLGTLLGDDLARPFNQNNYSEVWLRNTSIFNGQVGGAFSQGYIAILRANTVLFNLDNVPIGDVERARIEAEARFIRALCHFDLVRLWAHPYGHTPGNSHAGIALRTTTDVENVPRATVGEVYDFILNDLSFARQNLPPNVNVYASQQSANALEAMVRFQMGQYDLAYTLADEVINSGQVTFDESTVNRYQFPVVSPEAVFYIFSFEFNPGNVDSRNGGFRGNYNSLGDNIPLRVSTDFYNAVTATNTQGPRASLYEQRLVDENEFFVTNQFDSLWFHIPVLSYTQMLLVRAECAGEINQNLPQAIEDINRIRQRAYGSVINNLTGSATAQDVINAARTDSRFELALTGQRVHDLKRRAAINGENLLIRGVPYDCNGMILQFPATEETELFTLNPGGGC